MSFLVAAALAVAVLVIAPVMAHLLRRSRADEREFPPARLVPVAQPVARQRSRLEDRTLLAIRSLMVVGLAVLGATPFVRCSRLSIARQSGGSVALALIVDDSLSMRAVQNGKKTRFEAARDGARDLLGTAREGDAVAIVLAGSPARLALAATTDLAAARRSLDELSASDRATDLDAAVQLARSALKQLPHTDRRVVLLSDFAGAALPPGEPPVWAPLAALRAPADDCGVVSAESRGRRASAIVACSSAQAARGRTLEFVAGSATEVASSDAGAPVKARAGDVLASSKLEAKSGVQTVVTELGLVSLGVDAKLTGHDSIAEDDRAPVAPQSAGLVIGVLTDTATSSATTGGPSVLEQALEALGQELALRPLSVIPEDDKELAPFAAILLDDPSGLGPETRAALNTWLTRGGVAVAFLGRRAESSTLGSTLEPFASGGPHWEPTHAKGVDPKSVAWLGAPGASLSELTPRGRVRLEALQPNGARVTARWDDGQAFAFETPVGRGLAVTFALPVSVEESDLALRPGFLAILDTLLEEAMHRAGPRRSDVGAAWVFGGSSRVSVEGPDGPLTVGEPELGVGGESQKSAVPSRAGRYHLNIDGNEEFRVVTLDPKEITTLPREPSTETERVQTGGVEHKVDVSSQVALGLLGLLFLELVLRAAGRARPRRRRRKTDANVPAADDSARAA